MLKLDRTFSTSGNIYSQKNETFNYKGLNLEEIGKVFAYLNSTAYNYAISAPPRMDKTIFSSRKN
jgi:hypothetical protein